MNIILKVFLLWVQWPVKHINHKFQELTESYIILTYVLELPKCKYHSDHCKNYRNAKLKFIFFINFSTLNSNYRRKFFLSKLWKHFTSFKQPISIFFFNKKIHQKFDPISQIIVNNLFIFHLPMITLYLRVRFWRFCKKCDSSICNS